jgi:outer membrane protein OmpA-like peptidoglycan-associated protein
MNPSTYNISGQGKALIAGTVALLLITACATAPSKPPGAADARAKLTQLQSNSDLATRAPVAMKDAEAAVRIAEVPQTDVELAQHNVYIADRKVEIAAAQARTASAEDQRAMLSAQRDKSRLDARTKEADATTNQLAVARVAIADQKREADATRVETDAARALAAAEAAKQSGDLQRQLDGLNAKATDRGMVLTLGDVLFATGKADLKNGATANLNKLVAFLNNYPDRTVMIEGYTDNVGSDDNNLGLSQRRADAVKGYLTGQGIAPIRLSSSGKGESAPVAGNDSAAGRQHNRRVEVIIANQTAMVR